ncbi:hypothetical protein KFL_004590040 [Klebsormidium nitens]|uniref:DUF819 domain-containing protein n=1 Tax=Klebsormidium nitens TaxID=105231 RepID=A0A1Y1IFH7_KLENI|nr:hypothetical protein KFL_004590040 [Klebsormidium nitens]|eukprot:GAQ88782.1 hypothetical protein KFL_004590040 [Klebsormidium nitens]
MSTSRLVGVHHKTACITFPQTQDAATQKRRKLSVAALQGQAVGNQILSKYGNHNLYVRSIRPSFLPLRPQHRTRSHTAPPCVAAVSSPATAAAPLASVAVSLRTQLQQWQASPLVGNSEWAVWAFLLAAGAAGLWSEKTTLGQALSGPLVSTLIGLALSNLGVLPAAAPAYAVVNKFLLPLAVPLLLFSADIKRVFSETGRLWLAFLLGAAATVAGSFAALSLFPLRSLGEDGWKMAAALMSRHIGGAVNYVAVSEALQTSSSMVAAGLAADNLICALYFTLVFALAAGIPPDQPSAATSSPITSAALPPEEGKSTFTVLEGSTALALSAAICAVGSRLSKLPALRVLGGGIPCMTAVVVALATLLPKQVGALAPAGEALAVILMQVFFATVGASGSVAYVVTTAPSLFAFSALQITVHLALTLGFGKLLGFSRRDLLLASNANVGGPSTAAGMATAKGWRASLVPAILVGIFGYATATFLSIYVGHTFFRRF